MDYLYGKLNELIDSQKYKINGTHPIQASIDSNNLINISLDTERTFTIKQVKKDNVLNDDIVKYYQLFAFNTRTGQFDIPLGEEIAVGNSSGGAFNQITSVIIANQEVPATVTDTGQLKLDYIPISVIKDSKYIYDPDSQDVIYYENIIDGND